MEKKDKDYVLKMVKERDVRFIRLWFTDILGFLKSFSITPYELEGALNEGMGFDGSRRFPSWKHIFLKEAINARQPGTIGDFPWPPTSFSVAVFIRYFL